MSDEIETTADPLQFAEALQWFSDRVPVTRSAWDRLDAQSRKRTFTASDVSSLDVLDQVWRGIDSAIANGDSYGDFRRSMIETLGRDWTSEHPGRVENIFRTNIQSAYAAGRYQQQTDSEVLADRPVWEFVAILDARTTEICRPLDGVVKLALDGFWSTHYPPLHFQCRSSVLTLSLEESHHRLNEPMAEHDPPLTGFGTTPDLSRWQPSESDYAPQLWGAFQRWRAASSN